MADDIRLERIEKKLDDQNEHLSSIDITMAQQGADWRYHVKRTNDLQIIVTSVNKKVTMAEGALKLLGVLALIGGLIEVVTKFIR